MRLLSHPDRAILLAVVLAATVGCHSAQKQVSYRPPAAAQAPPLVMSAAPAATQQQSITASASAPEAPAKPQPQPAQALAPDPVGDLIARVEKQYQVAQADYRAGSIEEARLNFDSALKLLLESGLNLQSDNRLRAELERVQKAIDDLERAALEQDEALAEQKSEPAPIDEANELTPPVDEKVKAQAEAEIKSTHSDLPLMMTDQVAGYINYFSTRGRGVVERALARSGRYEDMIRETLKEEGVPQDLIYLAQAESGFHPLAVSRAGARGMWQFMASRARGYGLERSWWVDDRQDPEKATRAAARHLKDLYGEFGDWYLAMAAYNSGPGTVQSAVKRTGYADFWELYRRNVLPRETRNYVPIIVAVTIMAKNPDQYGLASVVKEKPVPFDTVKISYPIDLRLVAECVDASTADLQDLNPSLIRLTTPRLQGKDQFDLRLPLGSADKFESAVAAIPVDKRLWWRYHKVQDGETLASIARAYHTSTKSIAQANSLDDYTLSPETRLIVPIAPGKVSDTTRYARAITRYRIRKGDTVESVADNLGVSAKMIRVWNRLKGNSLAGRKILLVHLPVTPGAGEVAARRSPSHRKSSSRAASNQRPGSQHNAGTQPASASVVHHRVKRGETLYSIATSYNTTVSALKKDNQNIAPLRPGMILVVHADQ